MQPTHKQVKGQQINKFFFLVACVFLATFFFLADQRRSASESVPTKNPHIAVTKTHVYATSAYSREVWGMWLKRSSGSP